MAKLIITEAMKNGINDVTKHKITYSDEYLEKSKQITKQIQEDYKNHISDHIPSCLFRCSI